MFYLISKIFRAYAAVSTEKKVSTSKTHKRLKKSSITFMQEGKVGYEELKKIIDMYGYKRKEMIIGPSIGVDCSVFDLGKKLLVATSDPVTFVSSGYYCININVNDIVSMGADPLSFMATIILPPDCERGELDRIMEEIYRGCREFDVSFGGGHTEVSSIVNRPLISGFMTGLCDRDMLRGSFNAMDGDRVLITKGVGIEGISIIAEKKRDEIESAFGKEFLDRALSLREMLSVYREALIARDRANGMHDATEGGLLNALYEICVASDVSIDVEYFPVSKETEELCKYFNINPLGLISSGTLIITTKDLALKEEIEKEGINVYDIGVVVKDGRKEIRRKGKALMPFERDEIVKI
jgi:hydrogenase maturation factor